MSNSKKKISIVHKNNVTKIYDQDGIDLAEQLFITDMVINFTPCSNPTIYLTISGPEVEIEIDRANVEIERKEEFSVDLANLKGPLK